MTMFQRKRIKEGLEEVNRTVDKHADQGLAEFQKSRWTGAALILIAILLFAAIVGGILYLI